MDGVGVGELLDASARPAFAVLRPSHDRIELIYQNIALSRDFPLLKAITTALTRPKEAFCDWLTDRTSTTSTTTFQYVGFEWAVTILRDSIFIAHGRLRLTLELPHDHGLQFRPKRQPEGGAKHDQTCASYFDALAALPSPEITEQLALIRNARDWSATDLGPMHLWPANIQEIVGLMLHEHCPVVMILGEQGIVIYNHAYRRVALDRHPTILGLSALEAWPEIRGTGAEGMMRSVQETGMSQFHKDILAISSRDGFLQEMYFDWSVLPVHGSVRAVYNVVLETTDHV